MGGCVGINTAADQAAAVEARGASDGALMPVVLSERERALQRERAAARAEEHVRVCAVCVMLCACTCTWSSSMVLVHVCPFEDFFKVRPGDSIRNE